MMVTDQARHRANLADRAEVERPAPYEWPHAIEKTFAERTVAGSGASPDEGGALPGDGLRFIMAERGIDRQGDRRHFRGGPQSEIDAKHIAVAIAGLEQFNDAAGNAHRRLPRLLALAVRHGVRIEDQDRIDVRRIIEL